MNPEVKAKKKKILISIIALGLILASIVVTSFKEPIFNVGQINHSNSANETGVLVLEYGITPEKGYTTTIDGESIEIELPDGIDTSIVGEEEHIMKLSDNQDILVKVVVRDTQYPIITGYKKLNVVTKTSKEDLEKSLKTHFKAEDPIDGEVDLAIEYKKDFSLSRQMKHEITIIAKDKNGNRSASTVELSVLQQSGFNKAHPGSSDKVLPTGETEVIASITNSPTFGGLLTPGFTITSETDSPHGNNSADIVIDINEDEENVLIDKERKYKDPQLQVPVEAKFLYTRNNSVAYSYDKKLTRDSTIKKVVLYIDDSDTLGFVSGYDNSGEPFGTPVKADQSMEFSFRAPDFAEEDYNLIIKEMHKFKNIKKK